MKGGRDAPTMDGMSTATAQQWNPELYQASHSWAWQYGRDLLQFLAPKSGERILDVGCGTGQLTAEIAESGAEVVGIDSSPEMIASARKNYPKLRFEVHDAAAMPFAEEFDAVFSNAAMHWVSNQEGAVGDIARALKPGGRFVFEMGGRGNIRHVWSSAVKALREFGVKDPEKLSPWYYPSIGRYASLLESHGLYVNFAVLFDRPTPLEGERGLATWLEMFGRFMLEKLEPEQRPLFLSRVEELAKPHLYHDGRWVVDYKRLRVMAVKG